MLTSTLFFMINIHGSEMPYVIARYEIILAFRG